MNNYIYVDELQETLAKNGTTMNKLAKQINVSAAVLSRYLDLNYDGSVENVNNKIKSYLDRVSARGNYWQEIIVKTKTYMSIYRTISLVHNMGRMGLIYGPSGTGKSIAAKDYADENPGTVYVVATPDSKSIMGLVSLIYAHLENKELQGSSRSGRIKVEEKLKGSDRLIIIDEAHELSNDALEEARAIHDATGCPLLLIGTDEISATLTDRTAGRILEQINSRLAIKRYFSLADSERDFEHIAKAYDVLDKAVMRNLKSLTHHGGLRTAVNRLQLARFIADGETVNVKHLESAEVIGGAII